MSDSHHVCQGGAWRRTSRERREGCRSRVQAYLCQKHGGLMAVVQTRDLTKGFKESPLGAINNVNLETHEGEFLVFPRPSGSGKTTIFIMIACLEPAPARESLNRA